MKFFADIRMQCILDTVKRLCKFEKKILNSYGNI